MNWVRMGAVTIAVVCVASSCSGGSEAEGALSASERPTSFEDVEFNSPIADFLGFDTSFGLGSEGQAEQAAQQIQAEEATAGCMREQGFTYTPVDQSQFTTFGEADGVDYFGDEWIAKYGFGISTQRFSQAEIGPDLIGYEDSFDGSEFADPNQDYVEGLSESERDAFYLALNGDQPEFDENATEEEMNEIFSNYQPTGCQAEGQEAVFGGAGAIGFYQEFGDELAALEERVSSDPRVVAYRQEVTDCVAGRGLVFTTMEDLYQEYETKLESIGPDYSTDPLEASGKDPETMTQEEIEEFYNQLSVLDDADRAALGELQASEIELAQAVVECGGGWLNETVVLSDVRAEYEQEFLDANSDAVAEFEGTAG